MPRPYTLFTGQWADLPFEEVARLASGWGYDGLEIAVSGDHLDAWRWDEPGYVESKLAILEKYNLKVWAISNHLKGQAVCDDPIDFRHEAIVGSKVWGDGDPEGVRQRAAEEMKHTARLAKALGVDTVVGFTGSSIWQYVAMFPPVPEKVIDAGYQDFADRWNPILDVFDECGVRFAHEVHPSEIAYDYWTTVRTLEAIGHREAFGLNWDPSHFMWQGIDPVSFIWDFKDRIYHVDCKDTKLRPTGRNTVMGSHLPWGDPRRGWDFVSAGRGDVPWESSFRALTAIGYTGPISVEWEDAGMDRLHGAPEALAALKKFDFPASQTSFDAAFRRRSRPRLWGTRRRIRYWLREVAAVKAAEKLRKLPAKVLGGVEQSARHPAGFLHEAVPHESCGGERGVVWPHGTVVVADGVVRSHVRAQGPDAPAGEHFR
jgi:sugar phosphate isomerase/epimerase